MNTGQTRDRLLLAAAELMHQSGEPTVSTRAVCERAGVEAPTLYHHFGSKQGLIDAVIQHGFNQYVEPEPAQDRALDPMSVCERAGVEAPTLYHHFGSKQGLIDAVIQHGFNQYVEPEPAQDRALDP